MKFKGFKNIKEEVTQGFCDNCNDKLYKDNLKEVITLYKDSNKEFIEIKENICHECLLAYYYGEPFPEGCQKNIIEE